MELMFFLNLVFWWLFTITIGILGGYDKSFPWVNVMFVIAFPIGITIAVLMIIAFIASNFEKYFRETGLLDD